MDPRGRPKTETDYDLDEPTGRPRDGDPDETVIRRPGEGEARYDIERGVEPDEEDDEEGEDDELPPGMAGDPSR